MEIENQNESIKRPTFLVVLSVFSLISISSGLLTSILGLISGPMEDYQVDEIIGQNMAGVTQLQEMGEIYWSDITLKILNLIKYTNANFYIDRLINLGAYAIGLNGVIFMLKGKKLGFHLYIVYNLIALISIYASAPASEIPSFYFILFGIISSVFIFMYSRNLKFMK
jgi:hypothetical protein